jgi:hypothetical protein
MQNTLKTVFSNFVDSLETHQDKILQKYPKMKIIYTLSKHKTTTTYIKQLKLTLLINHLPFLENQ